MTTKQIKQYAAAGLLVGTFGFLGASGFRALFFGTLWVGASSPSRTRA
jgi:hypothetical protein